MWLERVVPDQPWSRTRRRSCEAWPRDQKHVRPAFGRRPNAHGPVWVLGRCSGLRWLRPTVKGARLGVHPWGVVPGCARRAGCTSQLQGYALPAADLLSPLGTKSTRWWCRSVNRAERAATSIELFIAQATTVQPTIVTFCLTTATTIKRWTTRRNWIDFATAFQDLFTQLNRTPSCTSSAEPKLTSGRVGFMVSTSGCSAESRRVHSRYGSCGCSRCRDYLHARWRRDS